MAYGLSALGGAVLKLNKIECDISVSDTVVLCTLNHHYVNNTKDEVYAEYLFPYEKNMTVIDFSARIGVEKLENKIVPKRDSSLGGTFRYDVDKIRPGEQVITTVKYLTTAEKDFERTRVKIPTMAEQRFLPFGNQFTFDSYLDAEMYDVNINFVYHGNNVTNITSPTHTLKVTRDIGKVSACAYGLKSNETEVIIDVFTADSGKAKVYKYHDILGCFFKPEIDRFARMKNNWLFMIDITDKRGGDKYSMVCDMLEIAVRSLRQGDRFNVIFMKEEAEYLSDEFLPVTDGTLKLLSDWLLTADMRGKPSFYEGVNTAYKLQQKCTAVILSEGGSLCGADTFEMARASGMIKFYTVSLGTGAFTEYLKRLSDVSGGRMTIIPRDRRFDDEFIRHFNIITSPVINKIGVAVDEPVKAVVPGMASAVHYGDVMAFSLEFAGARPNSMKVRGSSSGSDLIWNINLDNAVEGGEEIKYYYIKTLIDNYVSDLKFDDSSRDEVLFDRIYSLSAASGVMSPFVSYRLTDSRTGRLQYVNIGIPQESGVMENSGSLASMKRLKSQEHFINIAKSQCADGSFRPPYMGENEDVTDFTADTLYDFMTECAEPELFFWQIRKAVAFLMDRMEVSEDADISHKFGEAISIWHDFFGGNDKISQKAAAISYIHRGK